MALDKTVQVELPEHGIAYKKISGKTYVYYVTATYRNEKGQPTCDRSSIGRLDEETGKLIPNRNYYEIYLKKPIPATKAVKAHGVSYVFEKVSKKAWGNEVRSALFSRKQPRNADSGAVYAQ